MPMRQSRGSRAKSGALLGFFASVSWAFLLCSSELCFFFTCFWRGKGGGGGKMLVALLAATWSLCFACFFFGGPGAGGDGHAEAKPALPGEPDPHPTHISSSSFSSFLFPSLSLLSLCRIRTSCLQRSWTSPGPSQSNCEEPTELCSQLGSCSSALCFCTG